MNKILKLITPFLFTALVMSLHAGDLDTIGVTVLNQVDPSLRGNGIWVAQPEAYQTANSNDFEVDPIFVGQPASLFTWISGSGTSSNFPNVLGSKSDHADSVATEFYVPGTGVAPQVEHVDNYDANFFLGTLIKNEVGFSARVVNQSFTEAMDDPTTDQEYDTYAANSNVLFLNAIATAGVNICAPATCYNGIAVNVLSASLEHGPTSDGRSKPDIIAPGVGATSFSTPYVSGAAAVLLQAGVRGDGGTNTNAQQDIRLVKALLLNGAVKPAGWTNGAATPLDARYGAGVLNLFNSWSQLKGGQQPFIECTSVAGGGPHPPGTNLNNEPVMVGWDFNDITNSDLLHDQINHYYFNLAGGSQFTLTSTLVWNRPASATPLLLTSINNLNLCLYSIASGNPVLCSTSMVDNVQHLYIPVLPPGRYDLQVEKIASSEVSASETYALGFEFFTISTAVSQTNNSVAITWPLAPAGFELQSTTNLNAPASWSAVSKAVSVDTNLNQNVVVVPFSSSSQFFRLQRP